VGLFLLLVSTGVKEIPIVNSTQVALIDDEDYDLVSPYRWCHHPIGYLQNVKSIRVEGKQKSICTLMHRLITGATKGQHVDHRSGDKLDNRRDNLRLCDRNENMHNMHMRKDNTSGYKGVCTKKDRKGYYAMITVNSRVVHLGVFDDPWSAAMAYDEAALSYFGPEFSLTNRSMGLI